MNFSIYSEIGTSKLAPYCYHTMTSELEQLKTEVADLRRRNSVLEEEKAELQRRYDNDYQKWKRFKKWVLLGRVGHNERSDATAPANPGGVNGADILTLPSPPQEPLLVSQQQDASRLGTRQDGTGDENDSACLLTHPCIFDSSPAVMFRRVASDGWLI